MVVRCRHIIIYSILLSGYLASAQTLGFRIGANVASQVIKSDYENIRTEPIIRTHFGVTVNNKYDQLFSTQLEVTYSGFGIGETTDGAGHTFGPFKSSYFKAGACVKIYPTTNANFHLGTELGFQLIKENKQFITGGDWGVFFGGEAWFAKNAGLGARYYLGISDVNDTPEIKQMNRAIQVSLLLRIDSKQLEEMGY